VDIDILMTFVLVLVRVGSVLAFLPFLEGGMVPRMAKALLAMVIAVVLLPLGEAPSNPTSWQPIQFLMFAAAEVIFGGLMGLSALLVFKCMRNAGELVGHQMGMALSRVADPVSGVESSLIGTFCDTVGVLVFFCVNGHHWMLGALHQSLLQWPLGGFLAPDFLKRVTVAAAVANMGMAVQLAAPLLLVSFTVSLLMAVVARLVPEINVLIIGFPLRIGVGLVGLTIFIPVLVQYGVDVSRTMAYFMGGVAVGS